MTELSKEEWVAWKSDPTTKKIYSMLQNRLKEAKSIQIVKMPVQDLNSTNFKNGYLSGWEDCLDIEELVTFKEEDKDDSSDRSQSPY